MPKVGVPDVPYRGIQPYRYVDHPIFFEREQEAHDLLNLVVVYRGVMLYGNSGAGKSSLINAGLVAGAIDKGFQPERIRVYPHDGGELVVERIPANDDGTAFLPSQFAPGDETTPRIVLSTAALKDHLSEAGNARPLLVFDQFEELVTLFDDTNHAQLQRRIVDLVVALLHDGSVAVKLLFVFREDYLASVKQLLGAAPELIDQALRITPPAAESLTKIIRGPFEQFPGHYPRELSPALAERLRLKLADRFGAGSISLSEVQTVCLRLWQSEDQQPLLELRGVQGLLEDYLGEELDAFPPDLKYPAVALLSGMVTGAGTRNVISAESLIDNVREEEDIPVDALELALDRLESESKLVRRERRRDIYLYEITSEFLVPWISQRKQELIRQRDRKRERRKILLLALAVGVLLAAFAGVAYLAVWAIGQKNAAKSAVSSEAALVLGSAASLQPKDSDTAMLLGLAALESSTKADPLSRGQAWQSAFLALEATRLSGRVATLQSGDRRTDGLEFSPDGRLVAAKGSDGRVLLWNTSTHRLAGVIRASRRSVWGMAFSRDGRMLATADDRAIRLWDVMTHKQLGKPIDAASSVVLRFSPDGRTIASASGNGAVRLWSTRTGGLIREATPKIQHGIWTIAFSPDGQSVAAAGDGPKIWLWRTNAQAPPVKPIVVHLSTDHFYGVNSVAFSPDGRTLAAGGTDGVTRLFDVRTHARVGKTLVDSASVDSVFFGSRRTIMTGDSRGVVRFWNARTQGRQGTTMHFPGAVWHLAASPDGKSVAAAGEGGSVLLWDVASVGDLGVPVGDHGGAVDDAVFSPDGTTVATAEKDGTVRTWSMATMSRLGAPIRAGKGRIWNVAFSPNGKLIASGGKDGFVRIWDAQTGKKVAQMHGHHVGTVWSVAFNDTGNLLVTAGADKTVRLWDMQSYKPYGKPLVGHKKQVNWATFSPDGKIVASAGADGTVRLWNVHTQEQIGRPLKLKTDPDGANEVAFSSDGHMLAAAGVDGGIYIWNIRNDTVRGSPAVLGGSDGVTMFAVAFNRDGHILASSDQDGLVWLWDTHTDKQLGPPLQGHVNEVYAVSFSPDGRTLVSAGRDGTMRLWQHFLFGWKDVNYLKSQVCPLVGRTLTKRDWKRYAPGIDFPHEPVCPAKLISR